MNTYKHDICYSSCRRRRVYDSSLYTHSYSHAHTLNHVVRTQGVQLDVFCVRKSKSLFINKKCKQTLLMVNFNYSVYF